MSGEIKEVNDDDKKSSEESVDDVQLRNESDSGTDSSKKSGKSYTRHLSLLRQDSLSKMFSSMRRPKSSRASVSTAYSTMSRDTFYRENADKVNMNETKYKGWTTIVMVVLVEAEGLPEPPDDGSSHQICCKFQLGSQTCKSKSVTHSQKPRWGERFKFNLHRNCELKVTLWDKGKQKNFMGSCAIDLSKLKRERSNDVWQDLDDGFGSIRLNITLCRVRNVTADESDNCVKDVETAKYKYSWRKLDTDWNRVGQMHVKIIGAKGLSGKPNAYSILEIDNERVQTHSCRTSSEPEWNKSYMFNVFDVTSTLDVKVYDNTLLFQDGFLGRVSIPLLQTTNGKPCWYALKDKNKRHSAKGNCPRILLETTMYWNPVKSALRVFRPKEVKHVKKPAKFDIPLIYSNIEFIKGVFDMLYDINESIKISFEWENRELSFIFLVTWLFFWYHLEIWMMPLMLILPFIYFLLSRSRNEIPSNVISSDDNEKEQPAEKLDDKSLTRRIHAMPEMTLTITNGIEYLASVAERLYNLASFKVPFLSYLTLLILASFSFVLYILPFRYILMALGIYKFTRKRLNPNRVPNNDLLDFLSRIPDNEMLKDWKFLRVPEPALR